MVVWAQSSDKVAFKHSFCVSRAVSQTYALMTCLRHDVPFLLDWVLNTVSRTNLQPLSSAKILEKYFFFETSVYPNLQFVSSHFTILKSCLYHIFQKQIPYPPPPICLFELLECLSIVYCLHYYFQLGLKYKAGES